MPAAEHLPEPVLLRLQHLEQLAARGEQGIEWELHGELRRTGDDRRELRAADDPCRGDVQPGRAGAQRRRAIRGGGEAAVSEGFGRG